MYWVKRKIQQIKRVIDFFPLIWNGFDFDYRYALDLFKKQLERQVKFMESDRAMTLDAKNNAQKIKTAIRLMCIAASTKSSASSGNCKNLSTTAEISGSKI